ncbi:hypothetical protein NDU88_005839 [Pleurodeles waltl]|uniref:Uncharacterized protein n=1 Tax=Pleurodeles waltl TaxID=8319 RepID=A0AAV7TV37_PLEWA|nr:hypothetical protein NDU88_005839 [Pleurodeles waltl]
MVRNAADVTAIFYPFNHSIPDLRQERTYTASAAVTSVWKRQWLVGLGKGLLPSHRRSWRNSWMGSSPSTRYSTVLQRNRSAPTRKRIFGVPSPRTCGPWGKRWEDIRRWSKKTAEAQLGMASQRGEGCLSHHDPPDVQDPGGWRTWSWMGA